MICPVPEDLPDRLRWPGLKAIGVVINVTQRDGKTVGENRYYILSKFIAASRFADAVRSHWAIENRLHWQLDVTFQEDQCRIRQGHADANFSILRRAALSLLKNETTLKVGIKNKRLTAGWDEEYLEKELGATAGRYLDELYEKLEGLRGFYRSAASEGRAVLFYTDNPLDLFFKKG